MPAILDNLIAAGKIPPVVAVLVGRLEAEERESDLSCNRSFSRFVAEELLPWARQGYRVTSDPGGVILAGSSLGGLGAACAALERPDLFGNVLAQSGAFWWKPEGAFPVRVGAPATGLTPAAPPALLPRRRRPGDPARGR